ncbi:MAG: OmpH family outer membrane protein [Alistipes sp.]|nr:OmpH family outer membrane protein [Alistipes sp.]
MKKSFMFALAAASMMVACGGSDKAEGNNAEATEVASATTNTIAATDNYITSGELVFVDVLDVMNRSKLYADEFAALEQKVTAFQQKAYNLQQGWAEKEQKLATDYNKLQEEATKIQEKYDSRLMTSLEYQNKMTEIQNKGNNLQQQITTFESEVQANSQVMAQEEQQLNEEQVVLMNKFSDLMNRAIEDINSDKRYKMIVTKDAVLDAAEELNISNLVLSRVDELYAADKAAE